jgi:hypothetical protein
MRHAERPHATESRPASERARRPDLSVVVASIDAAHAIASCLRALEEGTRGVEAEVVVVVASRENDAQTARRAAPNATVIVEPSGTLTPVLWARGFHASTGNVVAFTTAHFLVGPGWGRAMLDGVASGAVGVGGPIRLARSTTPTDWATYFLRYSAFLGLGDHDRAVVADIPGDNAAYERSALERHAESFANGFWEIDFHRRVRADGRELAMLPGAASWFSRSFTLRDITRQRFEHGRHFGAWRVRSGGVSRRRVIAASPLVPPLLLARIAARVARRPSLAWRFAIALPALAVLAVAWALGEVAGALEPEASPTG